VGYTTATGGRQRNTPENRNTPAGDLASRGVWSATLGSPGQPRSDLARSRRCTTSGRDTLFGNVPSYQPRLSVMAPMVVVKRLSAGFVFFTRGRLCEETNRAVVHQAGYLSPGCSTSLLVTPGGMG